MEKSTWKLDNESVQINQHANVVWEDDKFFTIQHKNQFFHGELVDEKLEYRKIKVKINHREFIISKDGPLDLLIEELGLNKVKLRKLKQLKSPMPGRIVSVAVKIGDKVEVGSELLTLEAMKMENVLKSEGIGVVKSININSNDVVDKGALLINFE